MSDQTESRDDRILRINLARAEMYRSAAIERLRVASSLVSFCLKTLVLLNGGAIIALLTVLGHGGAAVLVPLGLTAAFAYFIGGSILAMLAASFAFINQNTFWAYELAQAEWLYQGIGAALAGKAEPAPPNRPSLILKIGQPAAIAAAALSLVAFAGGAMAALQALRPLA